MEFQSAEFYGKNEISMEWLTEYNFPDSFLIMSRFSMTSIWISMEILCGIQYGFTWNDLQNIDFPIYFL